MLSNQESMIKELLDIKNNLEKMVDEKQNAIDALKNEIDQIKITITKISGLISDQSFVTADQIYDNNEIDIESQSSKLPKAATYSRKIFDSQNGLICSIVYKDGDIIVSFPDPKDRRLTFINYITKFVPLLKPVKEKESDMILDVKKLSVDNIEVVKEIQMKNIQNYETIEVIEKELKKLFGVYENSQYSQITN